VEQRSLGENDGWLGQLTEFIEIAERHPLGFLVAMLIIAIVWLTRQMTRMAKEKQQLARSLYDARTHGHEFDDDTTVVMDTMNRRKKPRT